MEIVIPAKYIPTKNEIENTNYPLFIHKSVINTVITKEFDCPYTDTYKSRTKTKESKKEINTSVFSEFIMKGPEIVRKYADITELLKEFCSIYTRDSEMTSFGFTGYRASFSFITIYGNIGELTITCIIDEIDEFGAATETEYIHSKIFGVIYYKHHYYAITNALFDWLNEQNKPKRQAIMAKLFY
jgi:hypothetical protein